MKWCNRYCGWCKHVEEQNYEEEITCDLDCDNCIDCEEVEY